MRRLVNYNSSCVYPTDKLSRFPIQYSLHLCSGRQVTMELPLNGSHYLCIQNGDVLETFDTQVTYLPLTCTSMVQENGVHFVSQV